ncbi:hypothetical protein POM88_028186 [Heracleum sosnowskyi]|uniref:Uncharacterized protein n=1 Tax=Heracleum sosnowskyi TaxID=360622 RepID=A0AAD8I908_9APIA|nr:hypothetical protein POM88_028186 [Heracleum sosnowskyi]
MDKLIIVAKLGRFEKMGNSKKFYRKKQRNNKAAAASASVSEEKTNYDSHDLEIMSCYSHDLRTMDNFGVSVVRTHKFLKYDGPPVVNSAGKVENWAAYGIPNSHGVFIPRTETHTGSGDQNPPSTISCDSRDLETIAGLGVSVVRTHKFCKYDGPPVKNSAGKLENWAAFGVPNSHGVFIPKGETHFGHDDQTPPATISCDSHDLKTMAPMGVSVVRTRTHNCCYKYDGPPVLNSAGKVENWAALGNPYIY